MTETQVEIKRDVEVIGVHKRTNGAYLISLRQIRPDLEEVSEAEGVTAMFGSLMDMMPKDMAKKIEEGVKKASQASRELRLRFAQDHSYDIQADYMLELSQKEYDDIMRPQVGHGLVLSLSTTVYTLRGPIPIGEPRTEAKKE